MKAAYYRISGLLSLVLLISIRLSAQKTITLEQCYEAAERTSALAGEKEAYISIAGLNDENLAKGWLPTLDVNGSILYNSSVIDLGSSLGSLPIPGIESAIKPLPHDQYRITLDVNQVLYDGGTIRSARKLEKAELAVNSKQTETDLYRLRSQVNNWYFNILLLDRQKELFVNYRELIEQRLRSVTSAIDNGVMLKSEGDVLKSELINLSQQLSENEIRRNSLLHALSQLTGLDLNGSDVLVVPENSIGSAGIARPEIGLFDLKKEQLSASEALISSKRMPRAFGFTTLGYGNPPGNNFFMDKFDTYYIIGAGIKWNIFDWNKARNEKQVLNLRKDIIDARKKDFTDNVLRQLDLKEAEITNLEKMIESDKELVELRKRITAAAESQHQNGVITATEYLNILNAEKQAVINSGIHRINLGLARTEYLNISGQEIHKTK
jgi:outer membrane protein TolC